MKKLLSGLAMMVAGGCAPSQSYAQDKNMGQPVYQPQVQQVRQGELADIAALVTPHKNGTYTARGCQNVKEMGGNASIAQEVASMNARAAIAAYDFSTVKTMAIKNRDTLDSVTTTSAAAHMSGVRKTGSYKIKVEGDTSVCVTFEGRFADVTPVRK